MEELVAILLCLKTERAEFNLVPIRPNNVEMFFFFHYCSPQIMQLIYKDGTNEDVNENLKSAHDSFQFVHFSWLTSSLISLAT